MQGIIACIVDKQFQSLKKMTCLLLRRAIVYDMFMF